MDNGFLSAYKKSCRKSCQNIRKTSFVLVFAVASALHLSVAHAAGQESFLTPKQQAQAFKDGWVAAQRDDLKKAYKIWNQLSQNPTNAPDLKRALENNLAVVLMRQKKYDQAQKRLDAALQADQQVAKTLDNLNQIYAYQAQKAYNRVFEKSKLKEPKGDWLVIDLNRLAKTATTGQDQKGAPESRFSEAAFEVTGLVEGWRQAWASQDVDRYLSFYDDRQFIPKNGMNYEVWERSRHRSLRNPEFIKVYLDDVQAVEITSELVRVDFRQRYKSDRFQDTIHKVLLWKKDRGDWKIIQEEVVYAKKN